MVRAGSVPSSMASSRQLTIPLRNQSDCMGHFIDSTEKVQMYTLESDLEGNVRSGLA